MSKKPPKKKIPKKVTLPIPAEIKEPKDSEIPEGNNGISPEQKMFASRTQFSSDGMMADLLGKDMKANEASKAIMTKVMTEKDFFSDVDDTHVLGIAGLLMLNEILESAEINTFVINWIIARKSRKGGRSRKDIVEMFKALQQEMSSKIDVMKERFGGMFS